MGKLKNWLTCRKYPFLRRYNVWNGKFLNYEYTWYDSIPLGWQKAFGKKLCRDLRKALVKDKLLKTFRLSDVKEKWGTLVLEPTICGENTQKVLDYYALLSMCYCVRCGKPVNYKTSGWISYLCTDCMLDDIFKQLKITYKKELDDEDYTNVDIELEKHRLTEDDIPKGASDDIQNIIDQIDWYDNWGIKRK